MGQTTIVVCVVLFLFLFFVLCARKSENYNYDPSMVVSAKNAKKNHPGYFYGGPTIKSEYISNHRGDTNVGRNYPARPKYDDDPSRPDYDDVDDLLSHKDCGAADLLRDNKAKICISEEQRDRWNNYYDGCKRLNTVFQYGGPEYCCIPPPPSCDQLDDVTRDDYLKLDEDDIDRKIDRCREIGFY